MTQPARRALDPERALPIAGLGWVVAVVVQAIVLLSVAGGDDASTVPIPRMAVAIASGWAVFAIAVVMASRSAGTGNTVDDVGLRFAPVDLAGIPLGVACQLGLIPLLYTPLRWISPDTFSSAELEDRAQRLVDRADGVGVLVLWIVVVVGAPVVEELFYRGLIQRSLLTRSVPFAIGASSIVFGVIHFSPVELPGLIVFGAVLGVIAWKADRLGGAIVTHAAFNATALVMLS